jgi:hypothetical protein
MSLTKKSQNLGQKMLIILLIITEITLFKIFIYIIIYYTITSFNFFIIRLLQQLLVSLSVPKEKIQIVIPLFLNKMGAEIKPMALDKVNYKNK